LTVPTLNPDGIARRIVVRHRGRFDRARANPRWDNRTLDAVRRCSRPFSITMSQMARAVTDDSLHFPATFPHASAPQPRFFEPDAANRRADPPKHRSGASEKMLGQLVSTFAASLKAADARRPTWTSVRSGKAFGAGIGPHPEERTIELMLREDQDLKDRVRIGVRYPASRAKCDMVVSAGGSSDWWLEIKMARLAGDNGKPDDTAIKDLLSPYQRDRSALTDCTKLLQGPPGARKAIIIYGFDWLPDKPLAPLLEAFEVLARHFVRLSDRYESHFADLVHPVHGSGRVCAWEVTPYRTYPS
jgi:hypothetical protein